MMMTCPYRACMRIYGSKIHLQYHYKKDHPDAIYDIDFPSEESERGNKDETKRLMDMKKSWIKEDVLVAQKKYIKKNCLFSVISDNIKEHKDYDEINQRYRRYELKDKVLQ